MTCAVSPCTARHSWTCRCGSTPTRIRTPGRRMSSPTSPVLRHGAVLSLNRYPDRKPWPARRSRRLSRARSRRPVRVGCQWVEVPQLLQAFGGPGRRALGFEPSYTMHRLIALGTSTGGSLRSEIRTTFTLDVATATRAVLEHHPDVVFLMLAQQPDGHARSTGWSSKPYTTLRRAW